MTKGQKKTLEFALYFVSLIEETCGHDPFPEDYKVTCAAEERKSHTVEVTHESPSGEENVTKD